MDIVEVTRRLAWGQVQCSRMCRGNYRPLVVYARSGVDPDPLLGELVSATDALAGLKWDHPNKPAAIGRRDRAVQAILKICESQWNWDCRQSASGETDPPKLVGGADARLLDTGWHPWHKLSANAECAFALPNIWDKAW